MMKRVVFFAAVLLGAVQGFSWKGISTQKKADSVIVNKSTPQLDDALCFIRGYIYSTEKKLYMVPKSYLKVTDNLWVHPSLKVSISNDKKCLILGLCVDTENPKSTIFEIAEALSNCLTSSLEKFYEHAEKLCGRYVIFYSPENGPNRVITDAVGLRPVYSNQNADIIAGHAELLAINLNKGGSSKDLRYKRNLPLLATGENTQFAGVYQLDCCYSLELNSGKRTRIFPRIPRGEITKQDAMHELASTVLNAIEGAKKNQDKPLLLSLTAGTDSRTTLSVLLNNGRQIPQCFTFNTKSELLNRDSSVAMKISKSLNIKHDVVECFDHNIPNKVQFALSKNSKFCFRKINDLVVWNLLKKYGHNNFLHICSSVVELWRGYDHCTDEKLKQKIRNIYLDENELSPYPLWSFCFLKMEISRKNMDAWSLMDIVYDTFCPYNCRKLIHTLLKKPIDFTSMREVHKEFLSQLPNVDE